MPYDRHRYAIPTHTELLAHSIREFHNSFAHWEEEPQYPSGDSRINSLERAIQDDFATIRETYGMRFNFLFG